MGKKLEEILFAKLEGEGKPAYIAGNSSNVIETLQRAVYPDKPGIVYLPIENLPEKYQVCAKGLANNKYTLNSDGTFILLKDMDLLEKERAEHEEQCERERVSGGWVLAYDSNDFSKEQLDVIAQMLGVYAKHNFFFN